MMRSAGQIIAWVAPEHSVRTFSQHQDWDSSECGGHDTVGEQSPTQLQINGVGSSNLHFQHPRRKAGDTRGLTLNSLESEVVRSEAIGANSIKSTEGLPSFQTAKTPGPTASSTGAGGSFMQLFAHKMFITAVVTRNKS